MASTSQAHSIIQLLQEQKIIPDIFSQPVQLEGKLAIAYPTHTVCTGETVNRAVTKERPAFTYQPFEGQLDQNDRYTLIEVDPDLLQPNDTMSGQVRHWVQQNISFQPSGATGIHTEAPLTEYLECAPGPPGHKHRYVFILARQSSTSPAPSHDDFKSTRKISNPEINKLHEDVIDRAGFNVEEYLNGKGYKVVAVTFMLVRPDAESLLDNAKLSGEAILHKIVGK